MKNIEQNQEWQNLRDKGCICECLNYDVDNRKDNPACPYHHGQGSDVMDTFVVAAGVNELKRHVSKCAHDHGWWPETGRNLGEMLMLMVSELAEGLKAWRDNEPVLWYDYGQSHGKPSGSALDSMHEAPVEMVTIGDYTPGEMVLGKPCGLASEFADTIIRILDTCETLDIPVTSALIHKHAYNLTRPYRHGGKKA